MWWWPEPDWVPWLLVVALQPTAIVLLVSQAPIRWQPLALTVPILQVGLGESWELWIAKSIPGLPLAADTIGAAAILLAIQLVAFGAVLALWTHRRRRLAWLVFAPFLVLNALDAAYTLGIGLEIVPDDDIALMKAMGALYAIIPLTLCAAFLAVARDTGRRAGLLVAFSALFWATALAAVARGEVHAPWLAAAMFPPLVGTAWATHTGAPRPFARVAHAASGIAWCVVVGLAWAQLREDPISVAWTDELQPFVWKVGHPDLWWAAVAVWLCGIVHLGTITAALRDTLGERDPWTVLATVSTGVLLLTLGLTAAAPWLWSPRPMAGDLFGYLPAPARLVQIPTLLALAVWVWAWARALLIARAVPGPR